MSEPTIDQVLNVDKNTAKNPSSLVPIIAFFILPPLGVYLLWKERNFHKILALLSLVLGVANFLMALSINFAVVPKLANLYLELNIPNQTNTNYMVFYMAISLVQILISFYLWRRAKLKGFLKTWELVVLSVLTLLVDSLILPILMGVTAINSILPIYQLQTDPYSNFPPSY